MLMLSAPSRTPDITHVAKIFQTGSQLVRQDSGSRHEVIRELASDHGLSWINALISCGQSGVGPVTSTVNLRHFREWFIPLFDTLTHPDVVSSFVLEMYLTAIFSFMYGPRGDRGEKLLSTVVRGFNLLSEETRPGDGTESADKTAVNNLESAVAVPFYMVELNSGAQIHPGIRRLADDLDHVVKQLYELKIIPYNPNILTYLSRLQARLHVGQSHPQYSPPRPEITSQPSFELTRDLPGELSGLGARHDNDNTDISKIRILPTLDEIRSERQEYRPTKDPSSWHQQGIVGLLDRQFRLLREDTIGQLRDAIRDELDRSKKRDRRDNPQSQRKDVPRTFVYQNVEVNRVMMNRRDGLYLEMSFQQPPHLSGQTAKGRREWWTKSRRLQLDGLVCLIGRRDELLFCTICDGQEAKSPNAKDSGPNRDVTNEGLSKDPKYAFATARLCTMLKPEVEIALRLAQSAQPGRLVEFPGILLPAFQHTLQALQKMSKSPEIPFKDFLVPSVLSAAESAQIPPPEYSMRPGFEYTLRAVMKDGAIIRMNPSTAFDQEHFKDNSSLDPAQCQAVVDALRRSLALIQGPPGTGKSYTGVGLVRILLDSYDVANLGPILCVCYTNHALDQLLEHLIAGGVKQIIRVGSRSKSEIVAPLNLSEIARLEQRTRLEKNTLWNLNNGLRESEGEVNTMLGDYFAPEPWKLVRDYLEHSSPAHHRAIFSLQDEHGFQRVVGDSKDLIPYWINLGLPGPPGVELSAAMLEKKPIDQLTVSERQKLYAGWVRVSRIRLQQDLCRSISAYDSGREDYFRAQSEVKMRCLQQARVIGITTSGLARNLDLLRRVRCKVLICEEAGEVAEAHMLTALLPSLQHLILIGDHQQLRPQIQRYELSCEHPQGKQYSLDVSLFERLVSSGGGLSVPLPRSILETQRRMHPSISRLIRTTLYPGLHDHELVTTYPQVVGIKHRLLWFDHREQEDKSDNNDAGNTSRTSDFEVGMAVALASHLIRQGVYRPNDIAVLTPYLGQLHKLRRVLGTMFELVLTDHDLDALEQAGLDTQEIIQATRPQQVNKLTALQALKVATIDNFQGEEAKVVIISLVRSNPENRCGFLRTPNRINVLLSRAQHGMYIIGNTETAGSVQMWHDVIDMLREDDLVKPDLELECPRHPGVAIKVRTPDGFQLLSPEGGCHRKCVERLACGHACLQRCHSRALHSAVVCLVPCPRPRKTCGHSCPRRCGEACPDKCNVDVLDPDRVLPCGHAQAHLPCWQSQDPSLYACTQEVRRVIPGCRHELNLPCYRDYTSDSFLCGATCGVTLPCGHTCQRRCSDCRSHTGGSIVSEDHGKCQQTCGRAYTTCRHLCAQACHGDDPCPLCEAPCEVACVHSRCSKKCHEPCTPCAEQHCESQCPHSRCSMPCAAPCDWIPCDKRCQLRLSCGHQCPTLCGESCPDPSLCQTCGSPGVRNQVVDFIEMKTYGEVDLDTEPCVIPACGHIMTLSSMDGHMDMASHYTYDANGSVLSVNTAGPFSIESLKNCPSCRAPLRKLARYGLIVRRGLLDESTKKFIVWSNRRMATLRDEFHGLEKALTESTEEPRGLLIPVEFDLTTKHNRKHLRRAASELRLSKRYDKIFSVRSRLEKFTREVNEEEQPFNRVRELCEDARRRRGATATFEVDDSVLQTKCYLNASALSVRCDLTIVSDLVSIVKNKVSQAMVKGLRIDLGPIREQTNKLLDDAKASQRPVNEVEAYLFLARCSILARATDDASAADEHYIEVKKQLDLARHICEAHPASTRGMPEEADAIERSLGDTFYNVVTSEERMEVLQAMARELQGTGHWYHCRNNHPFTVGECGGPMEETRCPECDEPVGGRHHRAAAGVTRASDLEELLRTMAL